MYDLKSPGHICLYGGTNTGKTVFMKYLVQKYIDAGEYKMDDIYIFTTNSYQWLEPSCKKENIFSEWCKIKEVKNKIVKGSKKGLILLDDFNNDVDTIHDKQYTDLFTRGRHMGIRIITVAHKPTSIGKDARESLLYAITGFSSNTEYITELSKYYFSNQSNQLLKLLKEGQQKGRYTMLVINKQTGETFTDKATLEDNTLTTSSLQEYSPSLQDYSQGNPNYLEKSNSSGYDGSINNTKNCMIDNSKNMTNYNIDNKIAIQQRYEDNRVNNDLKKINYKMNKEMEIFRQKDECHDLCMKWQKSSEEINKLIFLLNKLCSVSCVNHHNIEKWCKAYMNHNFPDVQYNQSMFKKIGNNYGMLNNFKEGNYVETASTITGYLQDTSLFKKINMLL